MACGEGTGLKRSPARKIIWSHFGYAWIIGWKVVFKGVKFPCDMKMNYGIDREMKLGLMFASSGLAKRNAFVMYEQNWISMTAICKLPSKEGDVMLVYMPPASGQ